eukprot:6487904-Amphidinium_carterae.1
MSGVLLNTRLQEFGATMDKQQLGTETVWLQVEQEATEKKVTAVRDIYSRVRDAHIKDGGPCCTLHLVKGDGMAVCVSDDLRMIPHLNDTDLCNRGEALPITCLAIPRFEDDDAMRKCLAENEAALAPGGKWGKPVVQWTDKEVSEECNKQRQCQAYTCMCGAPMVCVPPACVPVCRCVSMSASTEQ